MTSPPASEVRLYREAMRDVSRLAEADLRRYWKQFDLTSAPKVRDGLKDVLPPLVERYFLAAAAVSADWYDLQRANAGVRRSFSAIIPDPPEESRSSALAGWAVSPLFSRDPMPDIALTKAIGGLTRTVRDGGRNTIVGSTVADPAPVGWSRAGTGRCDFCRMLISRGAVYGSEASAGFQSHDHCGCDPVPEFG